MKNYPEQVYEAAKRTCASYGWEFQEVPDCDIWAGDPVAAVIHRLDGSTTAGISDTLKKQIAIRDDIKPEYKAGVLLHEMSHVQLQHRALPVEERKRMFGTPAAEERAIEQEADLVAREALHQLGLAFSIDRGNLAHAYLNPRLKKVADELARDIYANVREEYAA